MMNLDLGLIRQAAYYFGGRAPSRQVPPFKLFVDEQTLKEKVASTVKRINKVWKRLKPTFFLLVLPMVTTLPAIHVARDTYYLYRNLTVIGRIIFKRNSLRNTPLFTIAAAVVSVATIFFPSTTLSGYVSIRLLGAISGIFTNVETINQGLKQMARAYRASYIPERKIERIIADTIAGVAQVVIGITNVVLFKQYVHQLNLGAKLASNMDPKQLEGVLQHEALHHLPNQKAHKAVIIDGHNLPWQAANQIYEHCDTRYYRVNSSTEFGAAMNDAVNHFGAPIDVLATIGHASPELQILGENYHFTAGTQEITAMQHIRPNGQVLVLGCDTAIETAGHAPPLAARISNALPKLRVTGVAGLLYLPTTWLQYAKGTFHLKSYFPFGIDANVSLVEVGTGNNARTYQGNPLLNREAMV